MALTTKDRRYILLSLRIITDFGVTIAAPVVVFVFIGKYLDTKWGTKPWLLLIGFVFAFTLSALMIKYKATQYGKEYQSIDTGSEKNKKEL